MRTKYRVSESTSKVATTLAAWDMVTVHGATPPHADQPTRVPPLVAVAVALHELDVENLGHPIGELWRGKKPVNQLRAFVFRGIGQELFRLVRARDVAAEIEPRAAEKFRVAGGSGERLRAGFGGDDFIHALRQRLGCGSDANGKHGCENEPGD